MKSLVSFSVISNLDEDMTDVIEDVTPELIIICKLQGLLDAVVKQVELIVEEAAKGQVIIKFSTLVYT